MKFQFLFVLSIILTLLTVPLLLESSFAPQQEEDTLSPYHQWKKFADPDTMTCKQGNLLLQKNNGVPVCVMPSTYLKLIDRGYGNFDSSIMSKRPVMMNHLMQHMVSDEKLVYHWHEMLQRNPNMMKQTMDDWVSQMNDDSELLKNMLGPMTSDAQLREKMIETMKNHPNMENFLKQSPRWMESVHQPITRSDMMVMDGHGMDPKNGKGMCSNMKSENNSMSCGMNHDGDSAMNCPMCEKMIKSSCPWCPEYKKYSVHGNNGNGDDGSHSMKHTPSNRMMDVMHHMWINDGMSEDVHNLMVRNPSHMAQMASQMMEPMLNAVMDDETLRAQMMDMMLEYHDFMNTIRHQNPSEEGH